MVVDYCERVFTIDGLWLFGEPTNGRKFWVKCDDCNGKKIISGNRRICSLIRKSNKQTAKNAGFHKVIHAGNIRPRC